MYDQRLFSGATIESSSLFGRLFAELLEASRELRSNPRAYLLSALRGDGAGGRRRQALLKIGLAIGLICYSGFFLLLLIAQTINPTADNCAATGADTYLLPQIFSVAPSPDALVRQADKDSTSGGGGGGSESNTPATAGAPPPFSPEEQLIAPTTRPTLTPPALPLAEILHGNPANNTPRDDLSPTGLPQGVVGPPSDGFGKDGGIGTGNRGGVGSDDGPGLGTGAGGNTGDKDNNNQSNGRRDASGAESRVDSKPLALNKPRPNYTEEARRNKVQGKVRARVLVGADGLVRRVQILGGGLPDGLNEEAINAASQMRFRPAIKDGQPVAFWVIIEIEFNIR